MHCIISRLIIINDDDRYSGNDVAHSMFGIIGSCRNIGKRPKGVTQVRALSKMRPRKSDNKRQSFDKITQVQNID